MSIRKRPSKKTKSGYTYQVYFPYVNASGEHCVYRKGGFADKKTAQEFETLKKNEIISYGMLYVEADKTLNDCFEEALALAKDTYAKATYTYYVETYKIHVKEQIGKRKIISLTYKDLQQRINDPSHSYAIAKNIKKVLILAYKYAFKQGIIKENIVRLTTLTLPNTEDKEARNITEEKINLVCEEIVKESIHTPKYRDINWINRNYVIAIQIGKYTGLRVSEALALEKSDFDFENNTINICKRLEYHGNKKEDLYVVDTLKTKNSKAIIPLVKPLKDIMIEWFEVTPFDIVVSDDNGNYVAPSTMNNRFQLIGHKLGFRFTYHMLRHYYSSHLLESGLDPEIRMNLLRHSTLDTTSKYTHMDLKQKQEAANKAFNK